MPMVQAGDIQLEYFEQGSGKTCFVLVHGASSSAVIWDQVQHNLADGGFRSVAISLRGAGGSDRTDRDEDYSPKRYAEDLCLALTELNLPRFILVGHSLGVSDVLYLQRDYGSQFEIQALVLMAGGGGGGRPRPDAETAAAIKKRIDAATATEDPAARDRWEPLHAGLSKQVRDQLWQDIQNNPVERTRGQSTSGVDDMTEVLGNLAIPVLVVSGDDDRVVPLGATLPIYDKLPEGMRFMHVFHGVGHFPNGQIPDKLTDLFMRFSGTV